MELKQITWSSLTKEQLCERLGLAVSMLNRIAGEKEVWTVRQVKALLKIITAGGKSVGNDGI